MIGISTAAVVLPSAENQNIAILTDTMSAIKPLGNPEVKSKTKLECINSLNYLATKNQANLIWVPGQTNNERVDELANIAGALDTVHAENTLPMKHPVHTAVLILTHIFILFLNVTNIEKSENKYSK